MPTYTLFTDEKGISSVQRKDDDGKIWAIPMDEANSDYQAYQAYLASQENN